MKQVQNYAKDIQIHFFFWGYFSKVEVFSWAVHILNQGSSMFFRPSTSKLMKTWSRDPLILYEIVWTGPSAIHEHTVLFCIQDKTIQIIHRSYILFFLFFYFEHVQGAVNRVAVLFINTPCHLISQLRDNKQAIQNYVFILNIDVETKMISIYILGDFSFGFTLISYYIRSSCRLATCAFWGGGYLSSACRFFFFLFTLGITVHWPQWLAVVLCLWSWVRSRPITATLTEPACNMRPRDWHSSDGGGFSSLCAGGWENRCPASESFCHCAFLKITSAAFFPPFGKICWILIYLKLLVKLKGSRKKVFNQQKSKVGSRLTSM